MEWHGDQGRDPEQTQEESPAPGVGPEDKTAKGRPSGSAIASVNKTSLIVVPASSHGREDPAGRKVTWSGDQQAAPRASPALWPDAGGRQECGNAPANRSTANRTKGVRTD